MDLSKCTPFKQLFYNHVWWSNYRTKEKANGYTSSGWGYTSWGEGKHLVVTKYLGSLTFCCATAVDITKMFTDRQDNKIYDLPWARLFNISADRPNINTAIWRSLNEELQARNHKGLIEFINCTLHTVHNVFRKSVASHGCGEVVEQYAFDLHAWFKVSIFCTSVLTLSYPFLYKLVCGYLLNTDRVWLLQ